MKWLRHEKKDLPTIPLKKKKSPCKLFCACCYMKAGPSVDGYRPCFNVEKH